MKKLSIVIPTLAICAASYAQTDTTAAQTPEAKSSTLTLGTSYANNADYYGQKSAENMSYVAAVASYQHRSGFYLNALAYRLLKDSSRLTSATGLGGGFNFKLGKRVAADIGYNYTFFPKLSPFLQAANPHTASVSISHTGLFTTSLGADYAFGHTDDFFTTLGFTRQISLFSISDKDVVTLTPLLSATAGTQRFYEYYESEKNIRDSLLGVLLPPIFNPPNNNNGTTKTTTSFDLLSYNLKLPLAYNRSNYLVELACQLSLLSQQAQSDPGKLNTFFTASFYYQFSL